MSAPVPYCQSGQITLYHGDPRGIVPALELEDVHAIVCEPDWDSWPKGWIDAVGSAGSLWVFGRMEEIWRRREEFATWRFEHDLVWGRRGNGEYEHAFGFVRGLREMSRDWVRDVGIVEIGRPVLPPGVLRGVRRERDPSGVMSAILKACVPPGGLVLNPMTGSGAVLECARELGMRAVGVEEDIEKCRKISERMRQVDLPLEVSG